ncbi:MAG: thiamine phosphate synthase [Nitrospiraceae bacterium]|nr:thiamine phosphate synthase [Nitrospiraceae bacterium]
MTLFPRLLFLSGTQDFPDLPLFERHLRDLLDGGLPWFQLRDKALDDRSLFELALKIRKWTADSGCLFTINDRPDIAILTGADGVHLGQTDLSALEVRFERPRSGFHLGVSTHNRAEVMRALTVDPDYLGVGPIFQTTTKETGVMPRGPGALAETREISSLPRVAIGGLTPDNAREVLKAGAETLAISGILVKAQDPRALLGIFLDLLSKPPDSSS